MDVQEKDADVERRAGYLLDKKLDKEVDEARAIVRPARDRLAMGDVREARAIVRNALGALDADGSVVRRVHWLLVMAEVEFADSELMSAKDCLTKAVATSSREPEAVARKIRPDAVAGQISALRRYGLWRDALEAVEKVKEIPDEIRDTAQVRAAVGDFYRDCRCHAHASRSYTWRHGLRRSASWLRSGGPVAPIHTRVCKWEKEKLLPDLKRQPAYIDQVKHVGLESVQAQELRLQLETLDYRLFNHWYVWEAAARLGYRLAPACILPIWLVLWVVAHQAEFASGWLAAAGAAAVSAFIAASSVALLVIVLFRSEVQRLRAVVVSFFLAVVLVAAAA